MEDISESEWIFTNFYERIAIETCYDFEFDKSEVYRKIHNLS